MLINKLVRKIKNTKKLMVNLPHCQLFWPKVPSVLVHVDFPFFLSVKVVDNKYNKKEREKETSADR